MKRLSMVLTGAFMRALIILILLLFSSGVSLGLTCELSLVSASPQLVVAQPIISVEDRLVGEGAYDRRILPDLWEILQSYQAGRLYAQLLTRWTETLAREFSPKVAQIFLLSNANRLASKQDVSTLLFSNLPSVGDLLGAISGVASTGDTGVVEAIEEEMLYALYAGIERCERELSGNFMIADILKSRIRLFNQGETSTIPVAGNVVFETAGFSYRITDLRTPSGRRHLFINLKGMGLDSLSADDGWSMQLASNNQIIGGVLPISTTLAQEMLSDIRSVKEGILEQPHEPVP